MEKGSRHHFGQLLRHPIFLCLVSLGCGFILALLIFLPMDPFARHLEQLSEKQGFQLQVEQPQLLFPLGLGAGTLQISHKQLQHFPFTLENIKLRPLWLSLMSDNPGLSFEFETWQGRISGSAHRDGSVQLNLVSLQFEEPLSPELPLILEGRLVKGTFDGKLPLAGKNISQLQLELTDLRIKGMQKLGSDSDLLPLGRLLITAEAKGPLLKINSLNGNGPAFNLKGSGSLRLGRTAANSSLNLNLILTPKSALDPTLKDLLSLLKKPQSDGSYQLNLRGALSNLRIN